ncbi:Molybdopterin molybdenumtransferase OS=Castellaniella defragrans OX=75697 GN=HNR28_000683 PE=3 SV=1 [Castellaniella defragrans]
MCLPGNPVSSFVVFMLLVSPLVRGLQGRHSVFPPVRRGILRGERARGGDREEFLRVQADVTGGAAALTPYHQQSSGAISSLNESQGVARIAAGTRAEPGAEVAWYAYQDWLN